LVSRVRVYGAQHILPRNGSSVGPADPDKNCELGLRKRVLLCFFSEDVRPQLVEKEVSRNSGCFTLREVNEATEQAREGVVTVQVKRSGFAKEFGAEKPRSICRSALMVYSFFQLRNC
jgi:hypothetical protein